MSYYPLPNGTAQFCSCRPTAISILKALAIVHPDTYLCSSEIADICKQDGSYDQSAYFQSLMRLTDSGLIIRKKYGDKTVKLLKKEQHKTYWQIKDGYNMAVLDFLRKEGITTANDAPMAEASEE